MEFKSKFLLTQYCCISNLVALIVALTYYMAMVFMRRTIVSNKVMSLLQSSQVALSITQLLEKLKEDGLQPNRSTVYRILDKLVEKGVVSLLAVNNAPTYFEWSDKKGHHHHFFCYECKTLFCLSRCHVETLGVDLKKLLPNQHFKITAHDFNLYGVCPPCAK